MYSLNGVDYEIVKTWTADVMRFDKVAGMEKPMQVNCVELASTDEEKRYRVITDVDSWQKEFKTL